MMRTNTLTAAPEKEICCPEFHPEQWDGVKHEWNEKLFLTESIPEFLHIPLPGTYAKAIDRMWKKAEKAGAAPPPEEFLLLAHDPSPFRANLYMSVTKEVPGEETVRFTGTFMSKVYEGNYNQVPKFLRATDSYLASRELTSRKYYIYFPYCPKCAKTYGHNFVVVLADLEPDAS